MTENAVQSADGKTVEALLREELSRMDCGAEAALPVLRHLLVSQDSSLFSDAIIARVRGMVAGLAGSFLHVAAGAAKGGTALKHSTEEIESLSRAFLDSAAMLSHLHALALEWQVTERLQARLALDPVVPPLLQTLISAPDLTIRDAAMKFLAAQARWCQSQRRMTLSFEELPAPLFHGALAITLSHPARHLGPGRAETLEAALRRLYDAGTPRLGLAADLIGALGNGVETALSVERAGVALFLTALAQRSGQERGALIFSTHEAHVARLALALRAAGLDLADVERQFSVLHPNVPLPWAMRTLEAGPAADILSASQSFDKC